MFGTYEIIILCAVLLLLFGSTRLPKLMRSVGQSVGEFQQGMKDRPDKKIPPQKIEDWENDSDEES